MISTLENLPVSLEDLDLTNNKISKVENSTILSLSLKKLNLTKNQISESKVLQKFTSLEELHLDQNPISK